MSSYKRVQGLEIWGAGRNGEPSTEFVLDYDFEKMLSAGVNPYNYYRKLSTLLFDSRICSVPGDDGPVQVLLRSSDSDSYDLWHVLNEPVEVDSVKAKLSVAGSIVKKRTGLDIRKKNQSYEINVCYDFIGSRELSMSLKRNMTDYMNEEVLPVGFKAEFSGGGWFERHKDRYAWLILLIIAVIYVMLAISFESLKLPFAVILMIPVSFIGLFLAFGLSELTFDQGGLCGIRDALRHSRQCRNLSGAYLSEDRGAEQASLLCESLQSQGESDSFDHSFHHTRSPAVPLGRSGGSVLVRFRCRHHFRAVVLHDSHVFLPADFRTFPSRKGRITFSKLLL